jgi:hypothetical protein
VKPVRSYARSGALDHLPPEFRRVYQLSLPVERTVAITCRSLARSEETLPAFPPSVVRQYLRLARYSVSYASGKALAFAK